MAPKAPPSGNLTHLGILVCLPLVLTVTLSPMLATAVSQKSGPATTYSTQPWFGPCNLGLLAPVAAMTLGMMLWIRRWSFIAPVGVCFITLFLACREDLTRAYAVVRIADDRFSCSWPLARPITVMFTDIDSFFIETRSTRRGWRSHQRCLLKNGDVLDLPGGQAPEWAWNDLKARLRSAQSPMRPQGRAAPPAEGDLAPLAPG